jgi:peptide deformylase
MALLSVLTYPDPFLKTVAEPVTSFDDALIRLSADMIETMYDEPGIGLAATQVGSNHRLFVMDVGYQKDDPTYEKQPLVIINPQIVAESGEIVFEEGCLSVPNFRAEINRASHLVLTYQDLQGRHQELEADGLQAICIQHETDHLDGHLFIDHLPLLKRKMVQTRLKKLARRQNEQP